MKKQLLKERLQKLAGIARKKDPNKLLKEQNEPYWPDNVNEDAMGGLPLIYWSPEGGYSNPVTAGPCGTGIYVGSDLDGNSVNVLPTGWPLFDYIMNNLPLDTPFNSLYWDSTISTQLSSYEDTSPCMNPNVSFITTGNEQNPFYSIQGYQHFDGQGYNLSMVNQPEYGQVVGDDVGVLGMVNSIEEIIQSIVDFLGITPSVLMDTYGLGYGSTWGDFTNFLGATVSYTCPIVYAGTSCNLELCQCECGDSSGCLPAAPTGCSDPNALNYYCTYGYTTGQALCDLISWGGTVEDSEWGAPSANNFIANDDICLYDDNGCTDPTADNYNPNTNIDDGSCEYEVICYQCEDSQSMQYGMGGELISQTFIINFNPELGDEYCPEGWEEESPNCGGTHTTIDVGVLKSYACKNTTLSPTSLQTYECALTEEGEEGEFDSEQECIDSGCGTTKIPCYQCKGEAPVGFMFDNPPGCPKGWQEEELTLDDCKSDCDNPLIGQWLNSYPVLSAHCCETGGASISCQEAWLELGGDPGFDPHKCCPEQPEGQSILDKKTINRLKELAGIKVKK